ncbi:O-antigen polymerase [Lacrimispora celerecrescens]|uniref:Oligosaccharide repeat unit polymerase n=1 Tax=Lacrimispora celerecrescens TaxID=29354 RepID=A0A084JQG8_9FIRM|nr:O-antigen polymerase [Lacrimispora celerecrescens]KEZ91202.1 hypothetical protein IO98_03895 [Lacrimispora celerecrescens]
MGYLVILILFMVGVCFWALQKSWTNFMTIYAFFWALIVFLANLQLFDMMDYSYRPYEMILLGFLGASSGYLFGYKYRIKTKNWSMNIPSGKDECVYNQKAIIVICIICIVFYSFEILKVIQLLRSGTTYYFVRRMYQGYAETNFFSSALERYFSSYVAVPCAYILSSYITISFFKKEKNIKVLSMAILGLGLYLTVSASRFILFQLALGALYLFFFLKKKVPKRIKKWIKRIVIALVLGVIALTLLRENKVNGKTSDWTMLQSIYSYFSVSIPLMDHWIAYADAVHYQAYGLVFLRVPLSIVTLLFLHPLGISFELLNDAISMINVVEEFVQVFPGHTYNAFASMFYYFYLDFKELGVIMGCFLWGVICAKTYKNARNIQSDRNLVFLLLVVQMMFKTMVRWELTLPSFFIAFVITFFIFDKNKKNMGVQ